MTDNNNQVPKDNPKEEAVLTNSPLFPTSSDGLIDEGKQVVNELKTLLAAKEKMLREQDELETRRALGGGSRAGSVKTQVDPLEEKKEKFKAMAKGTALERYIK